MQIINKGQANHLVFTLTEKVTLTAPYYLFEIINQQDLIPIYFLATDISPYPSRFNEFVITEGASAPLTGNIVCTNVGQYNYRIFEQTSGTNLSPASATSILETGIIKVVGTTATKIVYSNPVQQSVIYGASQ